MLFHVHSYSDNVSFHNGWHISVVEGRIFLGNSLFLKMTVIISFLQLGYFS